MPRTPVVVIGAGQAGLAVSHLLTRTGVDHVVLERGRPGQRWDSYPWESLRLLTPNWLSRLPGYQYTGTQPTGFMSARDVADYLRAYALSSAAPVVEGADVVSVRPSADAYRVVTTAGCWHTAAVVVATGWCDLPSVPGLASQLDPRMEQLTPGTYRNPTTLPPGGVLVVGASATGVQLADELVDAGRPVLLAVGSHTRLPRRYRGLDIMWWLDTMGVLDRRLSGQPAPTAARAEPSMQLAGRPDGRDVDLRSLQDRGVRLVGRVTGVSGRRVRFAADLPDTTLRADARLHSLLARIDAFAASTGLGAEIDAPEPVSSIRLGGVVPELDLRRAGIRTVIWATGYRRSYPWLHVPVLNRSGDIRSTDGATPARGLYVVGMRWQSRRNSSFLDGVRHDAATVAARVRDHLDTGVRVGRAA